MPLWWFAVRPQEDHLCDSEEPGDHFEGQPQPWAFAPFTNGKRRDRDKASYTFMFVVTVNRFLGPM
jgi:hypothetical protein